MEKETCDSGNKRGTLQKNCFFSVISQQDTQNVAANCSSITEKNTERERERNDEQNVVKF